MRLDLLGHGLRVEGASPRLQAWLREYWGFAYAGQRVSGPPVTLEVVAECPLDFPTSAQTTVVSSAEGKLACRNIEPRIWLGDPDCGVRLDLRDAVVLTVWGEGETQFAQLHTALTEVLRVKGWLPLHAAVVTKDGSATAFLGASGSGKTTALLGAVREGWQALAEDFVWLEPATFKVHRWDRGIRLLADTALRFSPLVENVIFSDVAGKRFFRYRDLGWSAPHGVLSRLYCLQPDMRSNVLKPVDKLMMTRLLWEATGVPMSKAGRDAVKCAVSTLLHALNLQVLPRGAPLPL